MEVSFVDENDYVKEGKGYFLSKTSQWETCFIISEDLNESLASALDLSDQT